VAKGERAAAQTSATGVSGRLRWFCATILSAVLIPHLLYGDAFCSVWCLLRVPVSDCRSRILRNPEALGQPAGS
jgi:hypothetical protein